MAKKETSQLIPQEHIVNKILFLREEKVMLDVHLAEIYQVETRALKQAVRRNIDLFPDDFMFELNAEEIELVVSQNVIPTKQHLGSQENKLATNRIRNKNIIENMKRFILFGLIVLAAFGCKKANNPSKEVVMNHPFSKVVILGNSITYAPANPSIGWNANWGMAASAPEKDYVHLLIGKFKQQNTNAIVTAKNIADFEVNYATYDFDAELKTYRDSKPDLLLLRIGENVQSTFDSVAFAKRYQALIAYMKADNQQLKVLAVGSFWSEPNKDYINNIMSRYTPYISLAPLSANGSNFAFDMQGVSDGVKQHPGDKGMQAIADMIWAKVVTMGD